MGSDAEAQRADERGAVGERVDLQRGQAERLARRHLQELVDDAIAQLDELERRQDRLSDAWSGVASDRLRVINDSPQVKALRASLAEARQKLAFRETALSNLTVRFSQKLQTIEQLENECVRLGKIAALRNKEVDDINASWHWRLSKALAAASQGIRRLVPGLSAARPNPMFDDAYYLAEYPDVRANGMNPYTHYLRHGIIEGRNPHALFDTDWYLKHNRDVLRTGIDPLLHYYKFGAAEGRDPHPLFDTDWYLERYPDVRNAGLNPLMHYVRYGAAEGRDPHPAFSTTRYIEQHPELRGQGHGVIKYYLRHVSRPMT